MWSALSVAAVLAIALAVWGFWIEPGRLVVRRTTLSLPNWPADNDGLRVAVLTDLHVGSPRHDIKKLRQIVAQVNSLNHDWWLDARRVAASLEAVGIPLLEDASAKIGSARRRFWLAGVSDYREGPHDVAAALRVHTARAAQ